jgi:hypothetical protein
LDIDTFEKMRGNRRKNRALILSRSSRERWYVFLVFHGIQNVCAAFLFHSLISKKISNTFSVQGAGFSSQDVASAIRQLRKDRHSRLVSAQQVGMDDLLEAKEKVTQGFKKLLFKKSTYEMSLKEARASIPNHGNHPKIG